MEILRNYRNINFARSVVFRGRALDNNEWVFGMPVPGQNGKLSMYIDNNGTFVDVDPNTIGQWTGLFTDDHFPIFENDLVKVEDGEVYHVGWDNAKAGFVMYNDVETLDDWSCYYILMCNENI